MSLISTKEQLLAICQLIKTHKIVAIDTEFLRETTYLPILCLIQLNVADNCYIIDPITLNFSHKNINKISSKLDLLPFFKILNSSKIIKIFHSLRQDMEVFFSNFPRQIRPKAVFDTQIMSSLCGLGFNLSYSKLVKFLLDKQVDKTLQRSNWQERPLPQLQLEYARIDVLYLPKIYQILRSELKKQRKLKWLTQEMQTEISKANNQDLCKNFPFADKSPQYQASIILLTKWRDQTASKNNVPKSFVLKDNSLDKIANQQPSSLEQLINCNLNSRIWSENLGTEIISLINLAAKYSKENLEKLSGENLVKIKLNEESKKLYSSARIELEKQARKFKINQELIINQNNLQNIIISNQTQGAVFLGWRNIVFGKKLASLMAMKDFVQPKIKAK